MDSTGDDLDTESGKVCRVGFPGWAQVIGTTPWLKTSSGVRHGRVRPMPMVTTNPRPKPGTSLEVGGSSSRPTPSTKRDVADKMV